MSTQQNNNHSNNGTKYAGLALVVVSVAVALFYILEHLFGYKLPDWLTFNILLELTLVFVLVLITISIVFFSKKIANFPGKEEFHLDVKLFILCLVLAVTISMFSFTIERYDYDNTVNENAATCESKASEGTKDFENKVKIKSEEQAFLNRFITFVAIATIFSIAQLCNTMTKNKYDETKIDLDYMQKRNRYVNYNRNNPNAVGGRKGFTKKKEELKYYSSMKNNYEAIKIFFAFISLIMGFSKLG